MTPSGVGTDGGALSEGLFNKFSWTVMVARVLANWPKAAVSIGSSSFGTHFAIAQAIAVIVEAISQGLIDSPDP